MYSTGHKLEPLEQLRQSRWRYMYRSACASVAKGERTPILLGEQIPTPLSPRGHSSFHRKGASHSCFSRRLSLVP